MSKSFEVRRRNRIETLEVSLATVSKKSKRRPELKALVSALRWAIEVTKAKGAEYDVETDHAMYKEPTAQPVSEPNARTAEAMTQMAAPLTARLFVP